MIDLRAVLAMARAEATLTRRLVRYWLFLVLSTLVGLVLVLYYGFLHRQFSAWSGTVALINPRYLVGAWGGHFVLIFLVGVALLSLDVRARDRRERVAEVLDSRPPSNLEVLLGRWLGTLAACWIPTVLVAGLLWAVGWLLGSPVEPWSLAGFLLLMALPAYGFVLALGYVLGALLPWRLVTGILLVGLLAFAVLAMVAWLPVWLAPVSDVSGMFSVGFPSDMLPALVEGRGWMLRGAWLLLALGLLGLAAALYPRLDSVPRRRPLLAGIAFLAAGGLLLGGGVRLRYGDVLAARQWKAAQEAMAGETFPRLAGIRGRVAIDPGRELALDLALGLEAPGEAALDHLVLALNPGLRVSAVEEEGGGAVPWDQHDGLLVIERALAAGERVTLRVAASGRPDTRYGYLDSVLEPPEVTGREANVYLLGHDKSIFDRRWVVLLPGISWLPRTGTDLGRSDPSRRPPDFPRVDLVVEVPEGWLVAGPGRREEAEGAPAGRSRFRFAPPVPVRDVALAAGPFVRRSIEVEGVILEALFAPGHQRNLDLFVDAVPELSRRIGAILRDARELGFGYPFRSLALVEVPYRLRIYGDGWQLGPVFGQPGIVFVRESTFPTARFDVKFQDVAALEKHEGGVGAAKVEWLARFFENDFSGGNVFLLAPRSFLSAVTGAGGREAVPLDFVLDRLAVRSLTGRTGYFSAHVFGGNFQSQVGNVIARWFLDRRSGQSFAEVAIRALTSRPSVWEAILDHPLVDLRPGEDPNRAVDALVLKGTAMARSVVDRLGPRGAARFLGDLRSRTTGRPYDLADVLAAAEEAGVERPAEEFRLWLEETRLPGFVAERAEVVRLPDDADGSARWQTTFVLRNDEEAPGMVRVRWGVDTGDAAIVRRSGGVTVRVGIAGDAKALGPGEGSLGPFLLGGHEARRIGFVLDRPPEWIRVEPYLSLNRGPFAVSWPRPDPDRIVRQEPFEGIEPVPWRPPATDVVVVDDLDEGFRAVEPERRGWRLGGKGRGDEEVDRGLPVALLARPVDRWSRASLAGAFGRYRHTWAFRAAGGKDVRAEFSAELPRAGRWTLEFHVPPGRLLGGAAPLGDVHFEVAAEGGREKTVLVSKGAIGDGWNRVDDFDLPAGTVTVRAWGDDAKTLLFADAIRWSPVGGTPGEER